MEEIETGYWSNGQLKYERPKLNGRYHGLQKDWHENGNKKQFYLVLNGNYQGIIQSWHVNGNKSSSHFYVNGNLEGIVQRWNANKTRIEIRKNNNDLPHGPNVTFSYQKQSDYSELMDYNSIFK